MVAWGAGADEHCRSVEGPLGLLSLQVPDFISVEIDTAAAKVTVTPQDARERLQRERWGTVRAMLQNHITGVSEGHVAILRLVGVGYRASIEERPVIGKIVNLKVQYAHPVELPVPVGVTASTPQPTRILLEGANKEVVTQFAAEIRAWRKPEPYKGKVSACGGMVCGGRMLMGAGYLRQQRDNQVEDEEDKIDGESSGGGIGESGTGVPYILVSYSIERVGISATGYTHTIGHRLDRHR